MNEPIENFRILVKKSENGFLKFYSLLIIMNMKPGYLATIFTLGALALGALTAGCRNYKIEIGGYEEAMGPTACSVRGEPCKDSCFNGHFVPPVVKISLD